MGAGLRHAPGSAPEGTDKNRVWQVLYIPVTDFDTMFCLVDNLCDWRGLSLLCCVVLWV